MTLGALKLSEINVSWYTWESCTIFYSTSLNFFSLMEPFPHLLCYKLVPSPRIAILLHILYFSLYVLKSWFKPSS